MVYHIHVGKCGRRREKKDLKTKLFTNTFQNYFFYRHGLSFQKTFYYFFLRIKQKYNFQFLLTLGSLSAPTSALVPPVTMSTIRMLLLSLSATNNVQEDLIRASESPEG